MNYFKKDFEMIRRRFDYIKYDEKSIEIQKELKELFMRIEDIVITECSGLECNDIVMAQKIRMIDALEIAYMWSGKMIRDWQISERPHTAEPQEERNNE